LENSPLHIARQLRSKLPADKQEASWGSLSEQFQWFPLLHLLRAAENPGDKDLIERAALYQDNGLRLNVWLKEYAGTEKTPQPQEVVEIAPSTEKESTASVPATEPTVSVESTISAENETVQPPQEDNADTETDNEGKSPDNEPELKMPDLSKILQTPASGSGGLTFEPFHTVDYFASQGIKVDKEADKQTVTQLDRQVKSFTEWLKTMKKLSYQPTVVYTDPLVESQARSSLSNKEIVTEAMAEVWVKQGNYPMAAQVYAKLMLQHPEKTPYFAARLQDLKEKQ
jgi:hypothetical protein